MFIHVASLAQVTLAHTSNNELSHSRFKTKHVYSHRCITKSLVIPPWIKDHIAKCSTDAWEEIVSFAQILMHKPSSSCSLKIIYPHAQ
jgi:hypothetical protein